MKTFTSLPCDPEDDEETPAVVIARINSDLLAACEAALADTLKPQHLQQPDVVIPMLKAAIANARSL